MFGESRRALAQAPKLPQMYVADPRGPQFLRQRLLIELRVVSGARNTANIYDTLDSCARRRSRKTFHVRVECPTVRTTLILDPISSQNESFFGQPMKQEMKVDHSRIIAPLRKLTADCFIVRRIPKPEISLQFILCTHIIAWKYMQPPESSQRHIFR